MMDFNGFTNFPFPVAVALDDEPVKDYFYTLENETQLEMLNQSSSYDEFKDVVRKHMVSE